MSDDQEQPDAHASLKRQLLGPSSSKAGLKKSDRVSDLIYQVSKGSKFFQHEENRDKELTAKIDRLMSLKHDLETSPSGQTKLAKSVRTADTHLSEAEIGRRDLSQTIVHIDCDAFYAAVEQLDRPGLAKIPFAVGTSVLCTCNYLARQFGVRSGMASFVAKKLCPQLEILPMNFAKYNSKAAQVRAILAEYDPEFESASIDEAYLNLTACIDARIEEQNNDPTCPTTTSTSDPSSSETTPTDRNAIAWSIVTELRTRIHQSTQITVSAGLAPITSLAKVASDRNKPDGQFAVPTTTIDSLIHFVHSLPVRKVWGVGRVMERELDTVLGVTTVGQLYAHRGFLAPLFGDKAAEFLLDTYAAVGRTKLRASGLYARKSIGTERTFTETSSPSILRSRLMDTARGLEVELKKNKAKGRTLTLKVKLGSYELVSRQVRMAVAETKATKLYGYAVPMLRKLEDEMKDKGGLRVRLLGLRINGVENESTKVGPMDAYVIRY